MANVNDNSAVWQVCRYDEAQTVGGKTINQIEGTVNSLGLKCYTGSIYVNQKKTQWQIPIPAGSSADKCGFYISNTEYVVRYSSSDNKETAIATAAHINQDTGLITLPKTPEISHTILGSTINLSFYINYIVICLK